MKKLNLLKSVLDFLWIVSMPLIPIIIFFIPFLFLSDTLNDFPFKMNGQEVYVVDFGAKIILALMLISYLFLIYCLYLFRKVLRYFQKLKIFDTFVYLTMNRIGVLLVIAAFISGVPSFIYRLFYQNKFELDLSISPFILTLALGLFFMVLSEVFKIAQAAKDDSELTI